MRYRVACMMPLVEPCIVANVGEHSSPPCTLPLDSGASTHRRVSCYWKSGGAAMRQLAVGLAIMLVSLGWGRCSFGQEVPSPRTELRIMDMSPLNWISM